VEFQTDYTSSITCQNFRPSCQAHYCCLWRKRRMWRYLPRFKALLYKRVWNWLVVAQKRVSLSRIQFPICIVIARNTSFSASIASGLGEGPSSVVTVAVVSLVLHHQQCDNSAKYNQKTLSGLEPLFYMWRFIAFLPPGGPLYRCIGHFFEGQTAVFTAKWKVFVPVDLSHSLTHTHRRLLTEERIFSPAYYYAFETGGHLVKRHMFQLY